MLKPVKPRSNLSTERTKPDSIRTKSTDKRRTESGSPGGEITFRCAEARGSGPARRTNTNPAKAATTRPGKDPRGTRASIALAPTVSDRKLIPTLTPGGKKALRAQAHHLDPVVMIGEAGLSAGVIVEIERALAAHQLIKIRIFGDDREQRTAIMNSISEQCGCAPVQMIGKLLVVWRPHAEKAPPRKSKVAGKSRPERAGTAQFSRPERKPFGESAPLRRPNTGPITRVTKLRGVTAKSSAPIDKPVPDNAPLDAPLQETDMRDPGTRYVPQRPLPETPRVRASSTPRSSSLARPKKPSGKVAGVSLLRKVTRSGH